MIAPAGKIFAIEDIHGGLDKLSRAENPPRHDSIRLAEGRNIPTGQPKHPLALDL